MREAGLAIRRVWPWALGPLAFAAAIFAAPAGSLIVVCAPGFPGNTEQAQPTMDAFARSAGAAAGPAAGVVGAVYYETETGGTARLATPEAAFAIVPLPFFLKHETELRLEPRLVVVQPTGVTETWSLVAGRGRVTKPEDLADWTVTGPVGYAPAFIGGPLFGGWGALPKSATIAFTAAPLAALRRAAAGGKVAVVLDASQAAALSTLPFGASLEIVTRSKPLPGSLLCSVGDRLPADAVGQLLQAFSRLHETPEGAAALGGMRMVRFGPLDRDAIAGARRAFAAAGPR